MKNITIEIPRGMTPEMIAQTFTAYLIGSLAFRNRECEHGPYRMTAGRDESWQLDGTNDFWLHIDGERATVRCRYDREVPIIEAAVALFKARLGW